MQDKIINRLKQLRRGAVFTPKDFADLGSREAIDQALSRLVKANVVRRVGRGLYHYPKVNKRLGGLVIPPNMDAVANAVARRTGRKVAVSGATAVNRLGLSTQVPAKLFYVTDGTTRQVKLGNGVVNVQHVASKNLPQVRGIPSVVVQAIRHLGPGAVDDASVVDRIRQNLSDKNKADLAKGTRYATGWIADAVRKIVSDEAVLAHG